RRERLLRGGGVADAIDAERSLLTALVIHGDHVPVAERGAQQKRVDVAFGHLVPARRVVRDSELPSLVDRAPQAGEQVVTGGTQLDRDARGQLGRALRLTGRDGAGELPQRVAER